MHGLFICTVGLVVNLVVAIVLRYRPAPCSIHGQCIHSLSRIFCFCSLNFSRSQVLLPSPQRIAWVFGLQRERGKTPPKSFTSSYLPIDSLIGKKSIYEAVETNLIYRYLTSLRPLPQRTCWFLKENSKFSSSFCTLDIGALALDQARPASKNDRG